MRLSSMPGPLRDGSARRESRGPMSLRGALRARLLVWSSVLLELACGVPATDLAATKPLPFQSESLEQLRLCLDESFTALQRTAPGLHRIDEQAPGRAGRIYRSKPVRLPPGPSPASLQRMIREMLRPDERDITFYADVHSLGGDASDIEASLRLRESRLGAVESAALRMIARRAQRCVDRGDLVVHRVEAGWADAVGSAFHGIVVVDPATQEGLWLHVFESWTV